MGMVDHPYPCTKIMWIPEKENITDDIFATTGDFLRIWNVKEDKIVNNSLLNHNASS